MNENFKRFIFILFLSVSAILFSYCAATVSGSFQVHSKITCTHPLDTCLTVEAVDTATQAIDGTGPVSSSKVSSIICGKCEWPCDTCAFEIPKMTKGIYYLRLARIDSLYMATNGEFGCRESLGFLMDPADSTKRKIVEIGFWHFDVDDVQVWGN